MSNMIFSYFREGNDMNVSGWFPVAQNLSNFDKQKML